jgi:hypothetical protein
VPGRDARAALVGDVGLAQHVPVVSKCGRLGTRYVLQPPQVGVGDLAERDTARAALLLVALPGYGSSDVFVYEFGGGDVGTTLVIGALGDAPAMSPPAAGVGIALKPGRSDATLELAALVAKLGLVERLAAVLADDDVGARLRY